VLRATTTPMARNGRRSDLRLDRRPTLTRESRMSASAMPMRRSRPISRRDRDATLARRPSRDPATRLST
jgi:hypothetical protein